MSTIYQVASWANDVFGYRAMTALPLVFFVLLVVRQFRLFRLNLPIVAMVLAALPMLSPFATDMSGHLYYTALNHGLQADNDLKTAAILLVLLFCVTFYAGSAGELKAVVAPYRVVIGPSIVVPVFLILFVLMAMYLESDTIIGTGYGQIKAVEAPYSSLVNQAFNVFAAVFLNYVVSDQKRRTAAWIYLAVFLLAIFMARRTMAIGVFMLALYTLGKFRFTARQLATILITLAVLYFIGIARSAGLIDFLGGLRIVARVDYFSLPGGASNVFVGSMGVIDMWNSLNPPPGAFMPILRWFWGVNESQIYQGLGYHYNGGMHMANILYWNFGLIGVALGGFALGRITRRCDVLLRHLPTAGGTLAGMLAAGWALLLPITIWYSPVAIINVTIAIVVIYAVIRFANGPFLLMPRRARRA